MKNWAIFIACYLAAGAVMASAGVGYTDWQLYALITLLHVGDRAMGKA